MSKDIHKWINGRYILMFDEHTFFVFDNENDERMTALQTTERLNEQQATINKFREEELYVQDTLRFYYSQIEQKKHKIQILEKKNKQLEEENECLRDFINLFNMRQKWKLYNFAMKNRDCDND